MKLYFLLLAISVLFFASCSQDNITATYNTIEVDIEKRNNYACVQKDVPCDLDYVPPIIIPSASQSYNCFLVTFDDSLTSEEIHCLKYAYFTCFHLLRMAFIESDDPYQEMWCYPIGRQTISNTIDIDLRMNTGG